MVLHRAKVPQAHSVVVLTDDREDHTPTARPSSVALPSRTCAAGQPAERRGRVPGSEISLAHAQGEGGRNDSAAEFGLRLLARASLFHGMTRVYQELFTVRRDANEMYLVPVPFGLVGKDSSRRPTCSCPIARA